MEPFGFFAGLLSGAILSVFAQVISHPFIIRRDKKNRQSAIWNSECLLFKVAFLDTLSDLCTIDKPYSVASVLRLRFPSHQTACVRFSLSVTGPAKRDLGEAWKEYKKYHRDHEELDLRVSGRDIPESEQRNTVLEHINRLLSFAKET
jgi:hypothetical protein